MLKIIFKLWKRRFQLQKFTLRAKGAKIGSNNTFNDWIKVTNPLNLIIGDNNVFNEDVVLNSRGKLKIGSNNHFSTGVKILTTRLDDRLETHLDFEIVIGNNNWFAVDCKICASNEDIVICNNIIIGANSYISRSILKSGKYLRNPASK